MVTTPASLTRSTVIQKVFENIYDRLVDNVTSVSITGPVTVTIKTYTNSFPDKPLDEKSDYPILVVNVPSLNWDNFTIKKKTARGTFTVDIYTTSSEAADKFADAISNSIETYRDDLKAVRVDFVNLDSMSADQAFRGNIKVHLRSLTFSFKYSFTGSL